MEKDIHWTRKRQYKNLKLIADTCGIESILTSDVSRQTFAIQSIMQNVPLNTISSILGHSSLKTTQMYLKSLPTSVLDEFNEKIIGN